MNMINKSDVSGVAAYQPLTRKVLSRDPNHPYWTASLGRAGIFERVPDWIFKPGYDTRGNLVQPLLTVATHAVRAIVPDNSSPQGPNEGEGYVILADVLGMRRFVSAWGYYTTGNFMTARVWLNRSLVERYRQTIIEYTDKGFSMKPGYDMRGCRVVKVITTLVLP